MTIRRLMQVSLCVALAVAAAGCSGGVPVDGKVVKDGKDYTLAEGEDITITLTADDGSKGAAKVEKNGSFQAKGSDGGAVKPGKYKITIVHYQQGPPPPKAAAAVGAKSSPPMPKNKDGGETWEVSANNKTFTVDLSKYK